LRIRHERNILIHPGKTSIELDEDAPERLEILGIGREADVEVARDPWRPK
jgi:hypothetical protein